MQPGGGGERHERGNQRIAIAVNTDLMAEEIEQAVRDYHAGGAFSPETERRVSVAVLGDRRHGLG